MKACKPRLTAEQLLEHPRHMSRWLEGLPPNKIVTRDILANDACLAANFLKAHGRWAGDASAYILHPAFRGWLGMVINTLACGAGGVTVKRALKAVRAAAKAGHK